MPEAASRVGGGPGGERYARIVRNVRRALSSGEIAAITGVKERQVQNWAAGVSRPERVSRDRLLDLDYVIHLLSDVYIDEGIEIWLHGRNQALGGQRPLDLLAAGRFSEVLDLVEQLRSGAM